MGGSTTRLLLNPSPRKGLKLHNDILMFQQNQGESLSEAKTRFKDLLQKVPHHGIDRYILIQIFYDHVSFHLKHKEPLSRLNTGLHGITTERMERFENAIFKQREEINAKMAEMFGLPKELTTNRAPEEVLIREEAKSPITKNVNSISLTKGEEEKSDKDKVASTTAQKN
ncbi:hypothetical protein Tco_0608627 [Tanacetum coccineum]